MLSFDLKERGPIIDWLIKNNIAKGVSSANSFLILVTLLCFGTALFVSRQFLLPIPSTPTYLEDIPIEIQRTLPAEILNQIPSRADQAHSSK